MAGHKRQRTHDFGGGQRITTSRRPPRGPRRELGYPHDSVLVQAAPAADRRYIRQLFRRVVTRLADIMEDETPDAARVSSTLAHIAPDGTIITAHNGHGQISLCVRDSYSGRLRILPLLDGRDDDGLHIAVHDAYDPELGITLTDEIYICVETGNAHDAMNAEERAMMLGRYLGARHGDAERAASFLARLARRAGAEGSINITFGRLQPGRAQSLVIALFEGDSAEGRRLAAGMVPVMAGILQRDMILAQRPAAPRPQFL